MIRSLPFLVILSSFVLGACTLIIDLPEDCEDDECGAYVCADNGIVCLDSCTAASDCSAGFSCDVDQGVCVDSGCRPSMSAVRLEGLPTSLSQFQAAVGGSPEQLIVMASRREGLGFRRFTLRGEVWDDPVDSALNMVRLAEPNSEVASFEPIITAVRAGESGEGSKARFIMGWRQSRSNKDTLVRGILSPQENPPFSRREIFTERVGYQISDFDWMIDGDELLVGWLREFGLSTDVQIGRFKLESGEVARAAQVVSSETMPPDSPRVGTWGGMDVVTFVSTGGGMRVLEGQVVKADGDPLGHIQMTPVSPASQIRLRHFSWIRTLDRLVGAWSLLRDEGEFFYQGALGDDEIERVRVFGGTSLEERPVGEELDGKTALQASADGGGYAFAWIAGSGSSRDIWIQRYDMDGVRRGLPFNVGATGGSSLKELRLMETSDGLALVWLAPRPGDADTPAQDRLYYRRFSCDD